MTRAAVIALALAGCAGDELVAPHVALVGDVNDDIATGARAWARLGFRIHEGEVDGAECARRWYDLRDFECVITVTVVRDPRLREEYGTNALADRLSRSIAIDARETSPTVLRIAGAHEVGHLVLDTGRHTLGGVMGGSRWRLTDVDLELACDQIGICD